MHSLPFLFLAVGACSIGDALDSDDIDDTDDTDDDDDDDDDDDNDDNDDDDTGYTGERLRFDEFVRVTDAWVGDATCVGTRWESPESACQVDQSLSGHVVDFQTEDEVPEADWSAWFGNDPTSEADVTGTSRANGAFSATVPACEPLTLGASTPPVWELSIPTFQPNLVLGFSESGELRGDINSVSEVTANLVPGMIGVAQDEALAMVAGQVVGCDGDPVGDVQLYPRGSGGPQDAFVYYFRRSLPQATDDQPATNRDDGLFVALNLPPGRWAFEVWGWDGAAHTLLGTAELDAFAGSMTLTNVYVGHDDGVSYPASCLSTCE